MNWERILIDSVAAAIVGGAISVILIIIKEIFMDRKNYKELKTRIGDTSGGDLTNQHKKIEGLINERHNSIKEVLSEKTGSILHRVEDIQKSLIKETADQENRYNNLTEKQKEIKEHLEGIRRFEKEWEEVVTLNKELKERYDTLLKEYERLIKENSMLKNKIKEYEKGRDR